MEGSDVTTPYLRQLFYLRPLENRCACNGCGETSMLGRRSVRRLLSICRQVWMLKAKSRLSCWRVGLPAIRGEKVEIRSPGVSLGPTPDTRGCQEDPGATTINFKTNGPRLIMSRNSFARFICAVPGLTK